MAVDCTSLLPCRLHLRWGKAMGADPDRNPAAAYCIEGIATKHYSWFWPYVVTVTYCPVVFVSHENSCLTLVCPGLDEAGGESY